MATSRLLDKNDYVQAIISDGQANAWSDEMAEVHNSLGSWLGRGVFAPGMLNLAIVAGQLALDVTDGPNGFGAAVVGEAGNEQLVTQEGSVRITAAQGIVASTTNYVFRKQARSTLSDPATAFVVNQTGTRPANTEPVGSAVMSASQATSVNSNPVGRTNLAVPVRTGPVANRPAAAVEGRFWYDPATGSLTYDTGSAWQNALTRGALQPLGSRVVLVAPAGGDYTTLSAALAAITTATAADPWTILVSGAIAETAQITAKSNINVFFLPGASVTVTATGATHGVLFNSVVNTVWAGAAGSLASIVRTGANAAGAAGIQLTTCDGTVRLNNLAVSCSSSAQAFGVQISGGSPELVEVTGTVTSTAANSYGCNLVSSALPSLARCAFTGGQGAGGAGLHVNVSSPVCSVCTFTGGQGSGTCHGVLADLNTNTVGAPEFERCHAVGGGGGTSHGWSFAGSSGLLTARLIDCRGTGGDGAAGNHGLSLATGAVVQMVGGTFTGGSGGTGCYGMNVTGNALVRAIRSSYRGGGVLRPLGGSYAYAAATAKFQPSAAFPWKLVGATLIVTAATAGATVQLADAAAAGNAITAAQSLAATGQFVLPITSQVLLAAAAFAFTVVAGGAPADGSFTILYDYEPNYGGATTTGCLGAQLDSTQKCLFEDCEFLSNANSIGCYVTANGIVRSELHGGLVASGKLDAGGTRPKALVAAAAWNPAPVDRVLLDGGQTSVTCRAGTANGSSLEV